MQDLHLKWAISVGTGLVGYGGAVRQLPVHHFPVPSATCCTCDSVRLDTPESVHGRAYSIETHLITDTNA
jgi:hypothetical protein